MSLDFETYKPAAIEEEFKITPVETGVGDAEVKKEYQESDQKMGRKEILAKIKEILNQRDFAKGMTVDYEEEDNQNSVEEAVEVERELEENQKLEEEVINAEREWEGLQTEQQEQKVSNEQERLTATEVKEGELELKPEVFQEMSQNQVETSSQEPELKNDEKMEQMEADLADEEVDNKIFNRQVEEAEKVMQPEVYEVPLQEEEKTQLAQGEVETDAAEKGELVDPDLIPEIPVPDLPSEMRKESEKEIVDTAKKEENQVDLPPTTEFGVELKPLKELESRQREELEKVGKVKGEQTLEENEELKKDKNEDNSIQDEEGEAIKSSTQDREGENVAGKEVELAQDEQKDGQGMEEKSQREDLVDELITELEEEEKKNDVTLEQVATDEANESLAKSEEKKVNQVDLPPPMEFKVELKPLKELESQSRDLEEVEINQPEKKVAILEESEELVNDEKEEKSLDKEGKDWSIEQASQKQQILQKLNKLKEINQDLLKRMK